MLCKYVTSLGQILALRFGTFWKFSSPIFPILSWLSPGMQNCGYGGLGTWQIIISGDHTIPVGLVSHAVAKLRAYLE